MVELRKNVSAEMLQKNRWSVLKQTKDSSCIVWGLAPGTSGDALRERDADAEEIHHKRGVLSTLEQELQRCDMEKATAAEKSTRRHKLSAREPLFTLPEGQKTRILQVGEAASGTRGLTRTVKAGSVEPLKGLPISKPIDIYQAGLESYQASVMSPDKVIDDMAHWLEEYNASQRESKQQSWDSAGLIHPRMVVSAETLKKREARRAKREQAKQSKSAADDEAAHKSKMEDDGFEVVTHDDDSEEDEWTQVVAGGRHGRGLLPASARATIRGYTGNSVKVAKNVDSERNKVEPKRIVGANFYRHGAVADRKRQLEELRTKFDQDKKIFDDRVKRGRHS